jgi:hypothetical protein
MSPPSRRHPLRNTSNTEEKKRGQRLFGGLLSTLSQKSPLATNKPALHKKRDEIEQRQRDRLKRDDEERSEERRLKREELDRVRRTEQKRWERESLGMKHASMRARAGFLVTKAEPRLLWRPWELRVEEEDMIEKQREKVEDDIRVELERLEAEERDGDGEAVEGAEEKPASDQVNGDGTSTQNGESQTDQAMEVDDVDQKQIDTNGGAPEQIQRTGPPPEEQAATITTDLEHERAKADDHADDLVEGHDEDQVIY